MNKVLRTFAVAIAAPAIAGVALAGTAAVDPPLLNGTYGATDGDPYNVLTFATSCGAAGCTGTVTSNEGWTVPTTLSGGRWNFTISSRAVSPATTGTMTPPSCRCWSTRQRWLVWCRQTPITVAQAES